MQAYADIESANTDMVNAQNAYQVTRGAVRGVTRGAVRGVTRGAQDDPDDKARVKALHDACEKMRRVAQGALDIASRCGLCGAPTTTDARGCSGGRPCWRPSLTIRLRATSRLPTSTSACPVRLRRRRRRTSSSVTCSIAGVTWSATMKSAGSALTTGAGFGGPSDTSYVTAAAAAAAAVATATVVHGRLSATADRPLSSGQLCRA